MARLILIVTVNPFRITPDPPHNPALIAQADGLSRELSSAHLSSELALVLTHQRLELRAPGFGPVFVDPDSVDSLTLNGGNKRQQIARAVGVGGNWEGGKAPRVLDCSAGLLGDAMLLAALGCEVVAVERSVILHAMQRDALERLIAGEDDRKRAMAGRIALVRTDALEVFHALGASPGLAAHGRADWRPEVIYFDPMHPERRKAALVKKEMRVLRALVGEDADSGAVLRAAIAVPGVRRVALKMPRLADPLDGAEALTPVGVHEGKSVRYDVFSGAGAGLGGN